MPFLFSNAHVTPRPRLKPPRGQPSSRRRTFDPQEGLPSIKMAYVTLLRRSKSKKLWAPKRSYRVTSSPASLITLALSSRTSDPSPPTILRLDRGVPKTESSGQNGKYSMAAISGSRFINSLSKSFPLKLQDLPSKHALAPIFILITDCTVASLALSLSVEWNRHRSLR